MDKNLAKRTAAALNVEDLALARRLGISLGALRSWNKQPPEYARLALAALVVGIDPDMAFGELKNCEGINPQSARSHRREWR
jgi:hypothetical protein